MWTSGALSKAHHGLEGDCQACHVDAFVSVRDGTCMDCHEDDADPHAPKPRLVTAMGDPTGFAAFTTAVAQTFGKERGRCVECHTEHEGAGAMQPTSQQFCADCHEGMDTRLIDTKLENAGDFGTSHPQFQPTVLVTPGADPVYRRVSLDDDPSSQQRPEIPA